MKMSARVTAVIVNYNSGAWLARCLEQLTDTDDPPAIRVLDNASTDASFESAVNPDLDAAFTRADTNTGFARGVNRLAAASTTPYLLVLNPDCLVEPAGLEHLCAELDAHPGAGLVSGRVVDCHGREQRGSRRAAPTPARLLAEFLPGAGKSGRGVDLTATPPPTGPVEIEAVSGACMLVRTHAFMQLGGLDTGYPMHFEDLDFMTRLRNSGWSIRFCPDVVIRHAGGVSTGSRPVAVEWQKHAGLWRYMGRHCAPPRMTRPLWWLLIWLHALLKLPLVLRGRR